LGYLNQERDLRRGKVPEVSVYSVVQAKSLLTHLRASFAETSPALSSGRPDFQSWTAGKIDQKKEIRKSAAPGAAEGAAVGDLGQAKWKAEAQSGRPRGGSGAESRAQAQATSKDESWAS